MSWSPCARRDWSFPFIPTGCIPFLYSYFMEFLSRCLGGPICEVFSAPCSFRINFITVWVFVFLFFVKFCNFVSVGIIVRCLQFYNILSCFLLASFIFLLSSRACRVGSLDLPCMTVLKDGRLACSPDVSRVTIVSISCGT